MLIFSETTETEIQLVILLPLNSNCFLFPVAALLLQNSQKFKVLRKFLLL